MSMHNGTGRPASPPSARWVDGVEGIFPGDFHTAAAAAADRAVSSLSVLLQRVNRVTTFGEVARPTSVRFGSVIVQPNAIIAPPPPSAMSLNSTGAVSS